MKGEKRLDWMQRDYRQVQTTPKVWTSMKFTLLWKKLKYSADYVKVFSFL